MAATEYEQATKLNFKCCFTEAMYECSILVRDFTAAWSTITEKLVVQESVYLIYTSLLLIII